MIIRLRHAYSECVWVLFSFKVTLIGFKVGKVLFPRHIRGKGVRIRGSFCFLLCFGSSWILDPPPPLDLTHVATLQKLEDVRKAGISPLYIPQSCIPSCYSVQPGKHWQASFFLFCFFALNSMEVTKGEDGSAEQAASLFGTREVESQRSMNENKRSTRRKIIIGVCSVALWQHGGQL